MCGAALACVFLHVAAARADGDPASDVLLTQSVFVPGDAGIPSGDQARLAEIVRAASAARFPIRIALVGSSYDLGSVAVLWRKPRTYARFLGTELASAYRGRLLVVMPNGFGFYHGKRPVRAELALLDRIPFRRGAAGLAAAASAATLRLAAAAGRRLVVRPVVPAPARSRGRDGRIGTWVALGAGLGVVAVAWGVSLHLRPLRRRRAPWSSSRNS